jgi:uncharacterized protein (TIGR02217 family)
MAIDPQQLSAEVEIGARGGPTWNTTILVGDTGIEQRNTAWTRPIYKYTIGYGTRLIGEAAENVINMFNACQGSLHGFLFKDWSDYTATAQPIIDGVLYKTYTNGTRSVNRKISRPVAGYTTGGGGTTWTGTFLVPVRFDDDHLDIAVTLDGLVAIPSVRLIEVLE